MDLDQLRTFVAIAETGSVSAAARSVRLSQAAATKQLQRLESELGQTLLVRSPTGRGQLTPAGERLLGFARQTLASLEALRQDLGVLRPGESGRLVVAASTIPGEYLLPRLLAAFRSRYPGVDVEVAVSDTAQAVARVLGGEADLGAIGRAVIDPRLLLERLASDEIVLAVPVQHPFASSEGVTVADLRGQSLVLRERGSGTRQTVDAALAAAGHRPLDERSALILGSTQAVIQAVSAGLGVGFVSARAAAQALAGGHLATAPVAGVDLCRTLYLVVRAERAGESPVGQFLEIAREQSLSQSS